MTSTAALPVNTAVTAHAAAAASAPSAQNGFGSNARADFRKPLQQARQQHQQQSQASRQAPANRDATASTSTKPTSASRHTSSSESHDQDEKDQATPAASTSTPDAATAMLALLGQSIPAQAAATPASVSTGGQGDVAPAVATLPTGLQAMAGLQGQGMTQPGMQADADDMLDTKSVDALKDDALGATTSSTDEGDETATSFTDVLGALAKSSGTGQSSQPASNDHGNTLDALNALVGSPLPQAQPAASITPAAHALTLQASAGTPAFAQELGQQVAWLGGQDVKEARIRLHPEDLGQLDVKVSVKQDHVDVSFIAQHPQAVHAVQQTLGQLDTLLAHHGLSLGHAEVGQGGRGNESGQGAASSGAAGQADDGSQESGGIASVAAPVIKAIGLLDTFA